MRNKIRAIRTKDIKKNDVVITVHGEAAQEITEELQMALNRIRKKCQLELSYCICSR